MGEWVYMVEMGTGGILWKWGVDVYGGDGDWVYMLEMGVGVYGEYGEWVYMVEMGE